MAYRENYENDWYPRCNNTIVYRYGNQCNNNHDLSRCNNFEMEYCFKAYPAASEMRWKDPDNECRTVLEFNRDPDFPWKYKNKNTSNLSKGLCKLSSDPNMQCALSWDPSDPMRNKGYTSLFRPRKKSSN